MSQDDVPSRRPSDQVDANLEAKERALSAEVEWQRAILECAGQAIIATDPDGLILHFNPAAEQLLGYRAEEVIGKHTPALIHDIREVVSRASALSEEIGAQILPGFEVFVAKARRGIREEREWTYIRKDGTKVPVLLSVTSLRNDQQNVIGFLGVAIDLSPRKELEARTAEAKAHELSTSILSAIAEGILCLDAQEPYQIRFANSFAAGLLGLQKSALIGKSLNDVLQIEAGSIQGPDGRLEKLKPMDSTAFEAEVRTPLRQTPIQAALTLARTGGEGEPILVLTIQDLSHRRQTEQTLKLWNKVLEVCSESVMITDATGTIVSVNPAFTWLTGYRPDEVVGQNPRILKSGKHDGTFYKHMWQSLLETGQWAGEIWDKRKDGSFYPKWVMIDALRENGAITHYVAIAHDISDHKAHEDRIRHLAEHDALTGLPNRRVLTQRIEQIIQSVRHNDDRFAVILIDLDRFKNINDTLGHLVGDKVLVEVSRRLTSSVRSTDTVVRLGGDEFVVLLADIGDPQTLAEIASNIHQLLGEPIRIDGRALYAPPSMGIACYPHDGDDVDTLLRNADAAMYRTKAHGRNGWTFYTDEMNTEITERLALEEALREALENQTLSLHFQPLIRANTQEVICWEALLRWEHPTLGKISPEQIIPIAEDTGLIHPIGKWVVETACQQVRRWADEGYGKFRVGVNVSPSQLDHPNLSNFVISAIETAGIAPDQLELEITEGVLMTHSPTAMQTLDILRKHGVLLTLDDFGTGYSSLTYLKTLSVDRVKIDRSFVTNVLEQKQDASIVQAIVMLANNLELGVVAEGVETQGQHDFLQANGCVEMQGFLLGHPMPAESIPTFLSALQSRR